MPLPTDVDELRACGVALVAGSITDLAGVTRAKYVPLRRLDSFQRAGMGVSPSWSVFCVDSGIAFTPNIGVDGDLRIRIDPADFDWSTTASPGRPATSPTRAALPPRCAHDHCWPVSNQTCAQRD